MATPILRDTHILLEKKMEDLDKLKKETSIKIREAASHGDLKENGEYHAAREEQSFIVRKTQTLQTHSPFKIIEYSEIENDQVGLYPLVITINSPFGQAIVGKKVNENFTLHVRGQDTKFTIISIEKISAK